MIRESVLAHTGIRLHISLLSLVGLSPADLTLAVQPRPEALSTSNIVLDGDEPFRAVTAGAAPKPAALGAAVVAGSISHDEG